MKVVDQLISVILPVNNRHTEMGAYLERLYRVLEPSYEQFEVIIVDDGSREDKVRQAEEWVRKFPALRYLRLSRAVGTDTAFSAGLDSAIGDFVVTCDLQKDPVELIPRILARCQKQTGIVTGRLEHPTQGYGLTARFFRTLALWVARRILGVKVEEGLTRLMAIDRATLEQFAKTRDKFRVLVSLRTFLNVPHSSISYQPAGGYLREAPWTRYFDALNRYLDMIVLNSLQPLRIVALMGLVLSFLNFCYIAYVLGIYFFKQDRAEGWVTLSFQNSVSFLLLFLTLSVLSEYFGRILSESKDRPLFFLLEEKSSSTAIRNENRLNVLDSTA